MPVFKVKAPDGMIIKVEAADQATAIRGAQEHYASKRSQPPKAGDVARDVVKSGLAGVGRGATGVAGFAPDFIGKALTGTVKNALNAASAITGRGYGTGEAAGEAAGSAYAAVRPGTAQLDERRQAAFGKDHVPDTGAGRFARTAGEFAVNAAVPGGALKRTAAVVVPAALSEAAGGLTKGKPYEGAARVAGAVAGGVGVGAMSALRSGPKVATLPKPAPIKSQSLEELTAAKNAAYDAVDQSGVRYKPQAFRQLAASMATDLSRSRMNPRIHPNASAVMDEISAMAKKGDKPTLTELDQLRQYVSREVAGAATDGERYMGKRMIGQIDQFISSTGPKHVSGGDGPQAAANLSRARSLNMRVRKIESVQDAVESAKLRAGSTGSGGNVDNAIRQNLRGVYEKAKNLTPEEDAAFRKAIVGGRGQNALRQVGKLSPQGNGLMAAGNLAAAAAAGPLGAIPGAAGMISKVVADGITKGRVDDIVRIIAQGGERAQQAERILAYEASRNARAAVLYRRVLAQTPQIAASGATASRPTIATAGMR